MLQQGTEDPGAAAAALQSLAEPDTVLRLAFQPIGSRAVQRAIEVSDRSEALRLAHYFEGKVVEALHSPHANYVLQLIVKALPTEMVPFLVSEILEAGPELAKHEYGCRIYIRLLELGGNEPAFASALDAVLVQARELILHPYGHYVAEAVLEHGLSRHQLLLVQALRQDVLRNARNRHAAHVIAKALQYGRSEDRRALVEDFVSLPPAEHAALSKNQFGSLVVRVLERMSRSFAVLKATTSSSEAVNL